MNFGNGVLYVNGRPVAAYADFSITERHAVKKPAFHPAIPFAACQSGVISVDVQSVFSSVGLRHLRRLYLALRIPKESCRKVGPRRLRTVWVRPSFASDVDSCLERGET